MMPTVHEMRMMREQNRKLCVRIQNQSGEIGTLKALIRQAHKEQYTNPDTVNALFRAAK